MTDSLAGVVLAAGLGHRLRPLTLVRPKALCPVANVALVDLAIERVAPAVGAIAVNIHHHRAAMEAHLGDRVHRSVEEEVGLGTAGAVAHLRGWLDGRDAVIVNGDAWCPGTLDGFVAAWDRERIGLLIVGEDDLRPRSRIAAAAMPWADVARLAVEPSGLYEVSWRAAAEVGRVQVARHDGSFIDCGTPEQYLAANLEASGGASVIGAGADVQGSVIRSVVWPDTEVRAGETLVDAIRYEADNRTVLVRRAG